MNALLYTLHVIISLFLIGGVLLQPGAKGGGMGSVFGSGSANSAFGARGAAPILAKLTYWLAGGFMVTCLTIEAFVVQHGRSVLDKGPAPIVLDKGPAYNPAQPQSELEPPAEQTSAPAAETTSTEAASQ
jgi:preprotein translocase subunit SecG